MKALSVYQPFAQLIVCGVLTVETRSWRTGYRGRLAVHASRTFSDELRDLAHTPPVARALATAGFRTPDALPRGAVLGFARLADCRPAEELHSVLADADWTLGDFRPGRWGWLLTHPVRLASPFPYGGSLGVFDVPASLCRQFLLGPSGTLP